VFYFSYMFFVFLFLKTTHITLQMKNTLLFIVLITSSVFISSLASEASKRPPSVYKYLQKYRYLSIELNQQTAIPIPVIMAIAGLESNWGESELALQANNHFGIKDKKDWQGWIYCKLTTEYQGWLAFTEKACFRKYPFIKESYQDFGYFIKTRPNYSNLQHIPSWNYRAWAEGLQKGGYATDPAYAEKILRIIWRYHLYEYDV